MRRRVGMGVAMGVALVLAGVAGPARAGMRSEPVGKLAVEGRWDEDLVADGGGPAAVFAPTIGWRLHDPTTELEARYGVDVHLYAPVERQRGGENHRARADETFELDRRTTLQLRQQGELAYDPTALSRRGVVRAGGDVLYLEGNAELRHELARRWAAGVGLRGEAARFDAPAAIDGGAFAPAAFTTFALAPRDDLGARYRLQLFTAGVAPSGISHEPSLTYARVLDRFTAVRLEAGPAIHAVEEGAWAIRPRGRAELRIRRRFLDVAVSAERTLVGAAGFAGPLWSDAASGTFAYRFSEALWLGIGAGAYRNIPAQGGDAIVGLGVEGTLERRLGGGVAARLAVRHAQQRDPTGIAVDISRNIFAAGLSWELDGDLPPR